MARKIGKILILGVLLLSWNLYLIFFTIPAFLIGVLLIWSNKKNIRSNLLWTFIPPVLWYPLGFIFLYLISAIGFSRAQKLDLIFPQNFRGTVTIVGQMPCGQKEIKKNGREQLFIPGNGIVLYQNKLAYGYVDHHYYFDLGDSLISIPERHNYMYFDSEKNPPPKGTVGVWLGGMGNKTFSKPNLYYEYMSLTVASKDSFDKYSDFKVTRQFEELTDSLVSACKK